MKNSVHHIEATNRNKWFTLILLSCLLILVALFWREETLLMVHRIMIVFTCALLLCYSFAHAVYSASMDDVGVSCSYFGKEHQSIRWEQIEEVAIIRDYRMNLRSSGNTRIVIVPKGCPIYNRKKWFGVQYIYQFRELVIWIDNTNANRKFIEERSDPIVDRCRNL